MLAVAKQDVKSKVAADGSLITLALPKVNLHSRV